MEPFLETLRYRYENLREFLEEKKKSLTQKEYKKISKTWPEQFEKFNAQIKALKGTGAEKARALHDLYEEVIAGQRTEPLSCGKGCSACCHYLYIIITNDEAELLAERARDGKTYFDGPLLERQNTRKLHPRERSLHPENRCAFLGPDGACQVYDDRPMSCRNHVVTSPKEDCADDKKEIKAFVVPEAELLVAAAYDNDTLDNLFKSVYENLL